MPPDSVVRQLFKIGGATDRERAERIVNEQLTEHRVGEAIEEFQRQEAEVAPDLAPGPEIIHHPLDEAQQSGESRLLGGAMQIRAPWAGSDERPSSDPGP